MTENIKLPKLPSLYGKTGSITDINTLLVNRVQLVDLLRAAVLADRAQRQAVPQSLKATNEEIAAWVERHDLGSLNGSAARCAFEDAESHHFINGAPPTPPARQFSLTPDQREALRQKVMAEMNRRMPIINKRFNDWRDWPGTWAFADVAVAALQDELAPGVQAHDTDGVPDDEAACANGNESILEAIESREEMLGNLLARIHRDGGHYVAEHGLEKAAAEAEDKVVAWLARDDAAPGVDVPGEEKS